jgi:hypothetical protein
MLYALIITKKRIFILHMITGQKFAMLEMKSTISKILREYQLQPAFPHYQMELVAETILKSD